MLIFHADDEALVRELVGETLRFVGHRVYAFDSSDSTAMTVQLLAALQMYGEPDIFILDGTVAVCAADGTVLYNTNPAGVTAWLRHNGYPGLCKFILYSNDDKLVMRAQMVRDWHFHAAVPKAGAQGGLVRLFTVVEQTAQGS